MNKLVRFQNVYCNYVKNLIQCIDKFRVVFSQQKYFCSVDLNTPLLLNRSAKILLQLLFFCYLSIFSYEFLDTCKQYLGSFFNIAYFCRTLISRNLEILFLYNHKYINKKIYPDDGVIVTLYSKP